MKNVSNKIVSDARQLNSNSDEASEAWPLELLVTQLARLKKYKTAIDFKNVFAFATSDDATITLTGFPSGDKLFVFDECFYGFKGLSIFFHRMHVHLLQRFLPLKI